MRLNSRSNLAWPTMLTFVIILGWMAFEGVLALVVSVGVLLTLLWVTIGAIRVCPGVQARFAGWVGTALLGATAGAAAGLLAPLVILSLMVFKTGVHAHGPEFTPAEINWVLGQFLRWGAVGLFAGLSAGLIIESTKTKA